MESNGRKSPLSPYILRVPSEILSEIFTIYLTASERDNIARRRELFFLGQICVPWRAIVWSMTQLWNDLDVDLTPRRFEIQVTLIGEWLARAGDSPLSLRIGGHYSVWDQRSPVDLVATISQYSRQWRDADLLLPFSGLQQLDAIQDHLPLLRSVMIRLADHRGVPTELIQHPIRAFSMSPRLYNVQIYQPFSPFQVLLPWHQLTTFYGQKLYTDEWLEVLRNSPNLIHCSFDEGLVPRDDALPISITPLPLLQLLSIFTVYFGVVSEQSIFDYIVVPAVREIALEGGGGPFPIFWVTSLLSRSSCILYRLSLTGMEVTVEQVRGCLRLTPTLVELELDIIGQDHWWDATPTDILVLPYLNSLSIITQTMRGLTQILDSLTVPSARVIELCGCGDNFNHFPFLALIRRSSCSLQRLTLDSFIITIASLSEIFTLVPSLVALRLTALDVATPLAVVQNAVINILCLTDPVYLLPNLQVFEYLDAPPFSAEDLETMLSIRWRRDDPLEGTGTNSRNSKTPRLHTVTITSPSMIQSDDSSRKLNLLRAEGLNLTIQITQGVHW